MPKIIPQTKIGNIALSKGMYIALMKRRVSMAYSNSFSCTNSPITQKGNNNYKFASCQKKQLFNSFYVNQHYFQNPQSTLISSSKKINKKKNSGAKCKVNVFNKENSNPLGNQNIQKKNNQYKEKVDQQLFKSKSLNCQNNSQFNQASKILKENTMLINNNNNCNKQKNQQWHKLSQKLDVEHTMFQVYSSLKKKKNQKSPIKFVPGYQVKFLTPRKDIFSFNCFREKDLKVKQEYSKIIDLDMDNDYPTDDEQVNVAVKNMFYSLCLAIHDEKQFICDNNDDNINPHQNSKIVEQ